MNQTAEGLASVAPDPAARPRGRRRDADRRAGQDGPRRNDEPARDRATPHDRRRRAPRARGRRMDRPAVAVLFGGRSSEHSISSATAGGVLRAINRDRYRVIPVGITRDGVFVLEDDDPDKFALDADAAARGRRQRHPHRCGPRAAADRDAARAARRRHGRRARRRRRRAADPARRARRGRHGPGLLRHARASRTPAAACSTRRCAWTSTS